MSEQEFFKRFNRDVAELEGDPWIILYQGVDNDSMQLSVNFPVQDILGALNDAFSTMGLDFHCECCVKKVAVNN